MSDATLPAGMPDIGEVFTAKNALELRNYLNRFPDGLLEQSHIRATYSTDVEAGFIDVSLDDEGMEIVGSASVV